MAVSNKAPLVNFEPSEWLQVFRGIARATDERTVLADNVAPSGVGNSAPVITYEQSKSVASTLVLANLNSLPLDWAARLSVGGVNMNFFIVKQLPVLPPEVYLNQSQGGIYIFGAIKIDLDATVKLFRLHLEDDPVPSTDFMHMHISPWY